MVFICEEMIRKRSEHNDGLIFSLEELSLHQLDIERIEHLDKWCRQIKILYLQANLIPKIENIGRLKRLEYLNLALNNITRIENLSGCESLVKLDLTLNFIREISSVSELRDNLNLEELYLTGNPCTQYVGYRNYVVVMLPKLQQLDGHPISRLERTQAFQEFEYLCSSMKEQEEEALSCTGSGTLSNGDNSNCESQLDSDEPEKFWAQKSEHNPETRRRIYEEMEKVRNAKEDAKTVDVSATATKKNESGVRSTSDGKILNVNEPKVKFKFLEEDGDTIILDVSVYKYLSTSLIRVDIQPTYVQIFIKEKLLQLTLPDEIKSDAATAQRSEATGHLLLTMPKVNSSIEILRRTCKGKEFVIDEGFIRRDQSSKIAKGKSELVSTQSEGFSLSVNSADDIPPLI